MAKKVSKKIQGQSSSGKAYKADTREVRAPLMKDRGPGSAFAHGFLREEARRLKSEIKIPGNLGYKQDVDISKITHRSNKKK